MPVFTREQESELRLIIADELRKILPSAFRAAENSAVKAIDSESSYGLETRNSLVGEVKSASLLLSAVGLELTNLYAARLAYQSEQVNAQLDTARQQLADLNDNPGDQEEPRT